MLAAASMLGFDAMQGQDQFFKFSSWWPVWHVERASSLAKALEQLQSVEFVTSFDKIHSFFQASSGLKAKTEGGVVAAGLSERGGRYGYCASSDNHGSSHASIAGSVTSLYGVSITSTGFAAEAVARLCGRHMSDQQRPESATSQQKLPVIDQQNK